MQKEISPQFELVREAVFVLSWVAHRPREKHTRNFFTSVSPLYDFIKNQNDHKFNVERKQNLQVLFNIFTSWERNVTRESEKYLSKIHVYPIHSNILKRANCTNMKAYFLLISGQKEFCKHALPPLTFMSLQDILRQNLHDHLYCKILEREYLWDVSGDHLLYSVAGGKKQFAYNHEKPGCLKV